MSDTQIRLAADLFRGLTVLTAALPWLVHGIGDDLSYKKYTARITEKQEYDRAHYDCENGHKLWVSFEYRTESGETRQGNMAVSQSDFDRYSVGDECVAYVYRSRNISEEINEECAKRRMKENIRSLVFVIPAFAVTLISALMSEDLFYVREMFPKSFYFSAASPVVTGAFGVYIWFIFRHGEPTDPFDRLHKAGLCMLLAVFCIAAVIAQTAVWAIAIYG